ncbi:MAG: efflux RND transporter periplasmic adaptor subunit [Vulcanimicrobiaceae bacterium]
MSTQILSIPRSFAIEKKHWLAGLALLLIVAAGVTAITIARSRAGTSTITAPVLQQTLVQSVSASGTLNPQNTVSVGTQVSGTIAAIYVDYNSRVKKGQVLAKLDPSTLQAQLNQAKASLAQAQAQAAAASQTAIGAASSARAAQASITVAQANSAAAAANARSAQQAIATADANVSKAQSALALAQQTLNRDNALLAQGYIAQSQADSDRSNLVSAQSALKAAQVAAQQARAQAAASVSQAQASDAQSVSQVAQTAQSAAQAASSTDSVQAAQAAVAAAQAQVQQDQLSVDRSVITSPVDGTVIARSVSVGQTVAASLQTPTLFTIAQDQRKMEVDIAVGEPDIGNVKPGDGVDFSVLAFPNQTFHGTVWQVRENPTTVNNVVTYTVITLVDNVGNKLLPGMTANTSIRVAQAPNALVVPLQALQYRARDNGAQGSPWGQTSSGAGTAVVAGTNGTLYVQNGRAVTPLHVKVDLVSGTQAAVTPLDGALAPGQNVVLADTSRAPRANRSQSASPAAPRAGGYGGGLGRGL